MVLKLNIVIKLYHNKGMMLLEVLLAILILSVGITTSIQALQSVVKTSKRSYELFEAYFISSDVFFSFVSSSEKQEKFMGSKKKESIDSDFKYRFKYEHDYAEYVFDSQVSSNTETDEVNNDNSDNVVNHQNALKFMHGQTTLFLNEEVFSIFNFVQDYQESEI